MFPDPGTFEFGYIVSNNFGCTWDTTLTVEVIDNPGTFITAGVDLEYCGGEIQLQGALDDGSPVVCGNAPAHTATATGTGTTRCSAIVRTTPEMGP